MQYITQNTMSDTETPAVDAGSEESHELTKEERLEAARKKVCLFISIFILF